MNINRTIQIDIWATQGKYSEALKEIAMLKREGVETAELLVMKARLLQLTEDEGELDEVERILVQAIELDRTFVQAHLELGWFLLNVKNECERALECFETALTMQSQVNTEIISGILKSAEECASADELQAIRQRAIQRLIDIPSGQPSGDL